MGKRFITAREVDDLLAAGKTEIEIDDNTVITDVGRERAIERGVRFVRTSAGNTQSASANRTERDQDQLAEAVKKAVVAHIGSAPANLDQIIARVIARY